MIMWIQSFAAAYILSGNTPGLRKNECYFLAYSEKELRVCLFDVKFLG